MGPVAPNLLSVTIQVGRVEHGEQIPYVQGRGETTHTDDLADTWIIRGIRYIGALTGDGSRILLLDRMVGGSVDSGLFDMPATYALRSSDDPDYAGSVSPVHVYRKSKPTDWARLGGAKVEAPMEHSLFLRLPRPMKTGKKYTLTFMVNGIPGQTFVYSPSVMRSDAVHVSHVGFRPDDPAKVAFLSLWMGTGGPMDFKEMKKFSLMDDKTGARVFEGDLKLSKSVRDTNEDTYGRNYTGADVYIMDFSSFRERGVYRVFVEQVGCSHPFEIEDDVWRKAFYVSVRGFYHQRSGTELGPPYTTFKRPRMFHPADGLKVYASKVTLMDTSNGFTSDDAGAALLRSKTPEALPDAWGGYCDAGDWDRRVQHLDVARLLLELFASSSSYFETFSLNIPKSDSGLPDLMSEALWGVDFYRRLQTSQGGVRGGIESQAHPKYSEASWQESWPVMAYAPDVWSSYLYAGVAARAGYVLSRRNPSLSGQYIESALRAMDWAEKEYGLRPSSSLPRPVKDARNLAASELFRATGNKKWNDLYIETTVFKDPLATLTGSDGHDQGDAAWVYCNTDKPGVDRSVVRNCRNAILAEAERRMLSQQKAGFRWTKDPWRPAHTGAFTIPDCIPVVRAHILTGKEEFLRAIVLATQMGVGANPLNISYTTGVGYKYPQHVLHCDARVTKQQPPPGITLFGPLDVYHFDKGDSPNPMGVGTFCHPRLKDWPPIETYWDVFWYPIMSEYTVHQTMAPNAYVWGYLAARK